MEEGRETRTIQLIDKKKDGPNEKNLIHLVIPQTGITRDDPNIRMGSFTTEVLFNIIKEAQSNEAFKKKLLDGKETSEAVNLFLEERRLRIPDDTELRVVEDTDTVTYNVTRFYTPDSQAVADSY
jgi:hypothetical protein